MCFHCKIIMQNRNQLWGKPEILQGSDRMVVSLKQCSNSLLEHGFYILQGM
jgi:hypothetical protein